MAAGYYKGLAMKASGGDSQAMDKLTTSLHDRLTAPTTQVFGDRRVQFDQQTAEIRKEIREITEEIEQKTSAARRGPIYLV